MSDASLLHHSEEHVHEQEDPTGQADSIRCEENNLNALESLSRRALRYERLIRDLETKMSLDLSNARAIDNLLSEVFAGLRQGKGRADIALRSTIPQITRSLQQDLSALEELEEHLPEVGRQVRDIRNVYDSGRNKAHDLIRSLNWLNTPISLRLRTIIFTSNAPVSNKLRVLVRTLFALVFLVCAWIAWITLFGAIRAHRQRLVWGERLMS